MTADAFHISRADCGCVRAVLLATDEPSEVEEFRREYDAVSVETAWPNPIRCPKHPVGTPSGAVA